MDSTFCRCLILISAAFFAGHAGSLRDFELVYLHHKLESIRTINKWISHPKTQLKIQCLNLIGTLILTEVGCIPTILHTLTDAINAPRLILAMTRPPNTISQASRGFLISGRSNAFQHLWMIKKAAKNLIWWIDTIYCKPTIIVWLVL